MGNQAEALARTWPSNPHRLFGTVRIAVGEWSGRFLMHNMPALTDALSDVEIEIVPSFDFMNLSRREADIALRNALPESGDLMTRLVAQPSRAIYGAVDYVQNHPESRTEARYRDCKWVGYDETRLGLRSAKWLETRCVGKKPHIRCGSSLVMLEAVRAGAGLAMLPCYIGDTEHGLTRVSATIESLQTRIWLVYHSDSRNRPAVMALVDRLDGLFARHRRLSVEHPTP